MSEKPSSAALELARYTLCVAIHIGVGVSLVAILGETRTACLSNAIFASTAPPVSKHHVPAVSDQRVVLKRGIRPEGGAKGRYKNGGKNR